MDIALVHTQLGRQPRGMVGVGYKSDSSKLNAKLNVPPDEVVVVVTSPRVKSRKSVNNSGDMPFEPFPTLFYLTHPLYAAALSRLEAEGYMKLLQDLITPESEFFNAELLTAYKKAHRHYIELRDELADELGVERLTSTHADFSAGGMPDRVKCLHALFGYTLATLNSPFANEISITLTKEQAEHVLLGDGCCNYAGSAQHDGMGVLNPGSGGDAGIQFNSACPIGDIVYAKLMLY